MRLDNLYQVMTRYTDERLKWKKAGDTGMAETYEQDCADVNYVYSTLLEGNCDNIAPFWRGLDTLPRDIIAEALKKDLGSEKTECLLGCKFFV